MVTKVIASITCMFSPTAAENIFFMYLYVLQMLQKNATTCFYLFDTFSIILEDFTGHPILH